MLTLLILASAVEAAPFVLPGDVPPLPPGAPWWVQYLVMAAPLIGWFIFSTVVAELNRMVRERDEQAAMPSLPPDFVPISPRFRLALAFLNRLAANHDKAAQQAALARVPVGPEVKP